MQMTDTLPVHVTVVIPTRNEEKAIVATIESVPNDGWCETLDFLIIDGSSTDRTVELAESVGAATHIEPRKGYGRGAGRHHSHHGCRLHLPRRGGARPGEEVGGRGS